MPDQPRLNNAFARLRQSWITPVFALLVILAITFGMYANQLNTANSENKKASALTKSNAEKSITSYLTSIEALANGASGIFREDPSLSAEALEKYVQTSQLSTKFKGVYEIGFARPNTIGDPVIQNIAPKSIAEGSGFTVDSLIDVPLNAIVPSNEEFSKARDTGENQITNTFISEALTSSKTAKHALVLIPVFKAGSVSRTAAERQENFIGTIFIPVDIDAFLDGAKDASDAFDYFSLTIGDDTTLSGSTLNEGDRAVANLETQNIRLNDKTMVLGYDDYSVKQRASNQGRQTTLYTGIGLAIMIYLVLTIMQLGEKRANLASLNAEKEIYQSEARFSALIKQSSDITLVIDSGGLVIFASPSIKNNLGYAGEEIIGKPFLDFLNVKKTKMLAIRVAKRLNMGDVLEPFEATVKTKDGRECTFECVINDLRDDPAVKGVVCNSRDITERKESELEVKKAMALYENALSNAPIGVALAHKNGTCFWANDALTEFLGLDDAAVVSKKLKDNILQDDQFLFSQLWSTLDSVKENKVVEEMRFNHPDGRARWGLISAQPVFDGTVFQYYVIQIEDTTERRSIAERLEYQAIHDPLTGMPNRLLLVDRLEVAITRAKRTGLSLAVMFIDLDRFKIINDSLGHAAGDQLLETVAERIKASVRPNDTIARFGGDEFVILCEDISTERQTQEISERLLENIHRPIMLREGEVYVTASIGLARSFGGDDTAETILRDADTAMYRAKDGGRNRVEEFDETTHTRAVEDLETGNGMFRALAQDEFRTHYQPVIDIRTGKLSGFEALVYWEHPQQGHIPPKDFIALAEETGVIVPLGMKVFETACLQLKKWHETGDVAKDLTMSINLSPRQLTEPTLFNEVKKIIERTGVDSSKIWFEITETALMTDVNSTIIMLDQIRTLGIHFEVDDFGTGYSSLSYLKKFPVEALKVDQSFVSGLGSDMEDTAIVAAVISLAHSLGLKAIAEGVEEPRHLAELRTLGCEFAQGFLYSTPKPGEFWNNVVGNDVLFQFSNDKIA